MKKTNLFCFSFLLILLLRGPVFGSENEDQHFEADTAQENDLRMGPQGTENSQYTYYGSQAGYGSSGIDNAFFGVRAGEGNSGDNNTFIGDSAALGHNTGSNNTFVGSQAGIFSTKSYNTFVGSEAGRGFYSDPSTGEFNSFFGYQAGYLIGSGYSNTFIGYYAGRSNTSGRYNTHLGYMAGQHGSSGYANTFLGYQSGRYHQTGRENTFVGYQAGYNNDSGLSNLFLGHKAGYNEEGSDKLYIENSDASPPLIYGEFDNRLVHINGTFRATATSVSSDLRWKQNIEPMRSCLEKVSALQGVVYEWKAEEYPGRGLTEGKQIGLIAQDVEKEFPLLVSEDRDGYKSVSYSKLTAVLVEAVKELKAKYEQQVSENERQQAEIAKLHALIKELKTN